MLENKQVIVDGVDVSECERHCSDNRNNPNMCYSEITRTYSNCNPKEKQCNFYITSIEKQLKAKEQECERLKNELLTYGATGICEVCTDKSVLQNDKYTKALREIKEIADLSIAHFDIDYLKQAINEILKECEVLNDK